jgi:hypothetical protein
MAKKVGLLDHPHFTEVSRRRIRICPGRQVGAGDHVLLFFFHRLPYCPLKQFSQILSVNLHSPRGRFRGSRLWRPEVPPISSK